jgi:hypothetical protein
MLFQQFGNPEVGRVRIIDGACKEGAHGGR